MGAGKAEETGGAAFRPSPCKLCLLAAHDVLAAPFALAHARENPHIASEALNLHGMGMQGVQRRGRFHTGGLATSPARSRHAGPDHRQLGSPMMCPELRR